MSQFIRVLAAVLLFGSIAERTAAAVIYTGGDVTVTSLASDANYVSQLGLYSPSQPYSPLLPLTTNTLPGQAVTFNPGNLGYKVGDELIFGIRVFNTGYTYLIGSGARNPDGREHARLTYQLGNVYKFGFEDQFGGGDQDYNDNQFVFAGGLGFSVPEPGTLALLGFGLVCVALVRRRRRN